MSDSLSLKLYNIYLFILKLLHFFIKKGKKNRLENFFRLFLILRSKTKKKNLYFILNHTFHNVLPFLNLKMRKRGKLVKYKTVPLTSEKRQKKALLIFSKSIRNERNQPFLSLLDSKMKLLQQKNNFLRVSRDSIHLKGRKFYFYQYKKVKNYKKYIFKTKGRAQKLKVTRIKLFLKHFRDYLNTLNTVKKSEKN
jgi:ribosomal protein S7